MLSQENSELVGLVIDAEGRDDDVFAGLDLEHMAPELLVYERIHLGLDSLARIIYQLGERGYVCNQNLDLENVWCIRSTTDAHGTLHGKLLHECPTAFAERFISWSGRARASAFVRDPPWSGAITVGRGQIDWPNATRKF